MLRRAIFSGQSETADASFKISTNPLSHDEHERISHLERHGFSVVALPRDWQYAYRNRVGGWPGFAIETVIQRILKAHEDKGGNMQTQGYNQALALKVLEELSKVFPRPMNNTQLKHILSPEPSDDELLTVLEALQLDDMIAGKGLSQHTSAQRSLAAMANITITKSGRKHLAGDDTRPLQGDVFHGDQIINYGQVAALGRNAAGSITYQNGRADDTDYKLLVTQLEKLRIELQKSATTRTDHLQIGLLAQAEEEAEKGDRSKMLQILSKAGENVLELAVKFGAEVAAKMICEATGLG